MKADKGYLIEIGSLYGNILDKIVVEKTAKQDTFETVTAKKPNKSNKNTKPPFVGKKSGPPLDQIKPLQKDKKFTQAFEKTESKTINNSMSKRFDNLFKSVLRKKLHLEADDMMGDVAPTTEPGDDSDFGADLGADLDAGPETDTDTADMTVEELLAKAAEYISLAQDKMAGEGDAGYVEEPESGELGDEGGESKFGSDESDVSGEATEMEELKDSKGQTLTDKNNKVASPNTKPASGKANGKVTDKVGNEDTGRHPLIGGPLGNTAKYMNPKGSNKVDASGYSAGKQIGQ